LTLLLKKLDIPESCVVSFFNRRKNQGKNDAGQTKNRGSLAGCRGHGPAKKSSWVSVTKSSKIHKAQRKGSAPFRQVDV